MANALHEAELLSADAIGEVIAYWGFRNALGRVWTVLYLAGTTLAAADIAERLSMSSGSVSTTLAELQRWGVVKRVWKPGERREFFEAETDFWKMISKVVNERERFLAQRVRAQLEHATELTREAPRSTERTMMADRLQRLVSFAVVGQSVLESFIASQRVDFQKFGNLLTLARRKVSRRS